MLARRDLWLVSLVGVALVVSTGVWHLRDGTQAGGLGVVTLTTPAGVVWRRGNNSEAAPDTRKPPRPSMIASATPAMAPSHPPPTARELSATIDDIRGMAPITFWTRPDGDTDTHRLCLELERQGRVRRIRETSRGWLAWELTEGAPH